MKKIPNTLLIGAQKSGTTSLFDWIAQHPDVLSDSAVKDFPYFWHEDNFSQGPNKLLNLFPEWSGQKIILAGNVNDMFFEKSACRTKEFNPDVKLIACLRNPIERAESAYRHAVERGFENRTFSQAINDELNGKDYTNLLDQKTKCYVAHGFYYTQLKRYLDLFDRSQVHIVLFDDIKKCPDMVMQDIFNFLGIDQNFQPVKKKKNVTLGTARFFSINKLVYVLNTKNLWWYTLLKKIIDSRIRARIRFAFEKINRKKASIIVDIDQNTRKLLCDQYQNEVALLSQYISRDLSGWLKL